MIALPQSMPYIRIGRASLALCQTDWLQQTLAEATTGTDVPAWMAADITRGVESFLVNHYRGTVIDSDELFERIEKTLAQLGLSDVAANIDKTPPPVRISLSELARRAGSGYELVFFQLLDEQLRSAATGGVTRVECHGLQTCVRRLVATKKWSKRCDHLRSEITQFLDCVRDRAPDARRDLTLSIAS